MERRFGLGRRLQRRGVVVLGLAFVASCVSLLVSVLAWGVLSSQKGVSTQEIVAAVVLCGVLAVAAPSPCSRRA
jgi:hypothetical protein